LKYNFIGDLMSYKSKLKQKQKPFYKSRLAKPRLVKVDIGIPPFVATLEFPRQRKQPRKIRKRKAKPFV